MNEKCSKCGRPLKTNRSKKRGFGKTCFDKLCKENERSLFNKRRKKDERSS